MRTVSPLDLRRSLGAILDAASAGERFLIERDHRPVAVLVSVEDAARLDGNPDELRQRRLAALDRLGARGDAMRAGRAPGDDLPPAAAAVRADRDHDG